MADRKLAHAWGRPLYAFLNSLDVSTPVGCTLLFENKIPDKL